MGRLTNHFAAVLDASPAKLEDKEAPVLTQSRAFLDQQGIPVWSGHISHRAAYSLTLAAGASASEFAPDSAAEISALWSAVARSVEAVNAVHATARAKHGQAA